MKHPLVRTARFLAGMALVLLGLSAYGCGDTGTATQPAELGNLSVSEGTLDPRFNPATTSYTVQLSTDVSSTTITATPRVAGDTIRIDNQQTSSQTVTLSSPGAEQSVNIVVTETGTGGTSRSYTVRVERASLAGDNSLADLSTSPRTLDTPFDKNTLRYTVSVDNSLGRITVTPTLSDPLSTMTVNGEPASSGQPREVALKSGGQVTTITITITAQDRSTKSYEIAVSRGASNNNNLSALTVSPGPLTGFKATTTAYTVNVGSSVTSVRVTPTLADSTAKVTVNGEVVTSGQQSKPIGLNPAGGSPTIITIIVIAQDGSPKAYSVAINRAGNNNLSGLTISPGGLDSRFSATDLSYTVKVDNDVDSVRVTPTLADPTTSTMIVNGQATRSGQSQTIGLNPAGSPTTITITVFPQNGTSKSYSVTVNRAAPSSNTKLSALSVTAGSKVTPFSPPFASNEVTVAPEIGEVLVRATKDQADATMAIGGDTVLPGTKSGQATFPLNGAGGAPTGIFITVTAENKVDIKTYAISVIRPAAPTVPDKPATTPDLIEADDSCALLLNSTLCFEGTHTDNITNVKRPGFSVLKPDSGQTAKLYIKSTTTGQEFPSSSTPVGDTLIFRPNTELPDGVYEVTYTLSNSVGESDKSPILGQPLQLLEINTTINN